MYSEQGASSSGSGQKPHLAAMAWHGRQMGQLLPVSEGVKLQSDGSLGQLSEIQQRHSDYIIRTSFHGQVHPCCKRPQRLPHHRRGSHPDKTISHRKSRVAYSSQKGTSRDGQHLAGLQQS